MCISQARWTRMHQQNSFPPHSLPLIDHNIKYKQFEIEYSRLLPPYKYAVPGTCTLNYAY